MAISFQDLKQAALASDRVNFTVDATDVSLSLYAIAKSQCTLEKDFLKENGFWQNKLYVLSVHDDNRNIFERIFAPVPETQTYPEYVGLFDWAGGKLSRKEINPLWRMDMGVAVVAGATEKDADTVAALFSPEIPFTGEALPIDEDGNVLPADPIMTEHFSSAFNAIGCPVFLVV